MSFSSEVKAELCRTALSRRCCAQAEAYGVLLYCNQFTASQVRISTESNAFAARLPALFHRAFQLSFDRTPEEGRPSGFSPSQSRTSCPPSGRRSAMSRRAPWPITLTLPCWRRSTAAWPFFGGPFWRAAR